MKVLFEWKKIKLLHKQHFVENTEIIQHALKHGKFPQGLNYIKRLFKK